MALYGMYGLAWHVWHVWYCMACMELNGMFAGGNECIAFKCYGYVVQSADECRAGVFQYIIYCILHRRIDLRIN